VIERIICRRQLFLWHANGAEAEVTIRPGTVDESEDSEKVVAFAVPRTGETKELEAGEESGTPDEVALDPTKDNVLMMDEA
jgi:hypothetical protein